MFAILMTLFCLGSCGKIDHLDEPAEEDTFIKTACVNLDIPETKSGDELDLDIYVYRNGALISQIKATSTYFEIPLVFSKTADYRYTLKAYMNYGGDNVYEFSNEKEGRFSSYGEINNIGVDDVDSIVIDMRKNVNSVKIESLSFDGYKPEESVGYDYRIRFYIANAPKFIGVSTNDERWNRDGLFDNDCPDLLYSEGVIGSNEDQDFATILDYPLFYYDSFDVALVIQIKSSRDSKEIYYHVPIGNEYPKQNQRKAINITIFQEGASTPFGELPEQSIKIGYGNIVNSGFDNSDVDVSVGTTIFKGVAILGTDEKLYDVEEWSTSGKSADDAVGVVVSDGEHRFMIHPTAEVCDERLNYFWVDDSCYDGFSYDLFYKLFHEMTSYFGSTSCENYYEASKDFNGHRHTLEYESASKDAEFPYAANTLPGYINYCRKTMFRNGCPGYLMSAGEITLIYKHITEVNECLNAIGGIPMDMNENIYMTSSIQYLGYEIYSWAWVGGFSNHVNQTTLFDATNIYVRAIGQY